MSTRFEIPEWLPQQPEPPLPPVDGHRVEGLVNRFITAKQEALFTAPDAFYRQQGGDAVAGAPAIARRLKDLRGATLDQAGDDGERAALGPRLDAHVDEAMDGIGRHVAAQRTVFQRSTLTERQRLIRRAAELEPDNDDKIASLAEAQAGAAQALAQLDGAAPGSPEEAAAMAAARSQLWRGVIEQRIGGASPAQALALYERVKDALSPQDRRALEAAIANTADDAATDAWLARQTGTDGGPLTDRLGRDAALSDTQRTLLRFKIAARESMAEAKRVAAVKGLDDTLAETTATIATQPSRYRIGTLAKLAEAYAAAGAPEQADATSRLALLEAVFLPFTQASPDRQQRQLDAFAGPERAMAEAILRHQHDAFARDPYAAGTALYPEVGPPLPEDDAKGRLTQTRMIEARRGGPVRPDTMGEFANKPADTAPADGRNSTERDRVWSDGQSLGADPNLVRVADGPESMTSPNGKEDIELAQAPSKSNPPSGPTVRQPGSSNPASKPTGSAPRGPAPQTQARPLSRQEQAAANRKEIDRLAGKPASDYPSEESFPADWERRLPQATLDAITREAKAFKVPPELLARIMWKESKFNEQAGVKEKHPGQGIAGITDIAMRQLIQNRQEAAQRDPNNGPKWGELEMAVRRRLGDMRREAEPAIRMEAEYLRYLYDTTGHSWPSAVASYKHGPTIINAFLKGERTAATIRDWGHVQAYLGKVFDGNASRFDAYK
jgi:Transglycosylase SLT domain